MLKRRRTYRPSIWARIFLAESWKVVLNPLHGDRLSIAAADASDIACLDITAIDVTKALIWHTVEVRSPDRIDKLSGLSAAAAQKLRNDLVQYINQHLAALIGRSDGQLRGVDAAVRLITDAKRQYLAHADVSQAIAGVPGAAAQALSHPLFDEARLPDAVRASLPASLKMITDPETRRRYNEEFVAHELERFAPFFDDLGGVSMAMEQREACIRLEDSNLLVASAGSGKSATMVGKVAYVLQKGLYAPEDILVLAYNTSAAAELKERIARQLEVEPDELGCRVTTFHALGFAIIKEVEGEPPRLANWVENASGEARFIETIISDLKERDEQFLSLWTDLLSLYPKADIPLEAFPTDEEYKRYIADNGGKQPESIGTLVRNLYVRSLQERRIVNWLWRQSVEFEYERRIKIPKDEGDPQLVHPDFFYPATGTIHEHFAIRKDGTSPFEGYVEEAALKRAGYAQIQADFFETRSADDAAGTLLDKLEAELRKREIEMVARSPEEVLKAIAPMVVSRYHRIIGVCVKHIRASRLTRDVLLKKAEMLHDKVRARHFVDVVWKIAEEYSDRLAQAQRIDYDSMIGDAVSYVETGKYRSSFSLILVDEFQDTSEPRANLVKALRHQKPFNKLFAVGDDWQSIYRFAGSDVTIFTDFETGFGASWMGRLERTYRCNQALADTAAAFVQRNPGQFRKTVVSTRPAVPRSIRVVPIRVTRDKPGFTEACREILDRLDGFLGGQAGQWRTEERRRLKVLVLWRYNSLDPFNGRPPRFENIEVSGLSFHRSKGLEADYTILLDVSDGNYGVPSRIEDDELLNLVIPRPETYPFAEERRLFYVALTRASRGTFLISNDRQPSPFIHELVDIAGDDIRFETADGRPIDICRKCLVGTMGSRQQSDGSVARACSRAPACRHVESVNGVAFA